MERSIMKDLLAWKASENRKPLILRGARQVGIHGRRQARVLSFSIMVLTIYLFSLVMEQDYMSLVAPGQ